jgi:hypothetical protein
LVTHEALVPTATEDRRPKTEDPKTEDEIACLINDGHRLLCGRGKYYDHMMMTQNKPKNYGSDWWCFFSMKKLDATAPFFL